MAISLVSFPPPHMTTEQKKLYQACSEYERHFFLKLLQSSAEIHKSEDESPAQMSCKTLFLEAIADSSSNPLGITQYLFQKMDKK